VSLGRRIAGHMVLARPHNCLLAAASVLIGCLLAGGAPDARVLAGAAAAFLIPAGGYALNDIYDLEADRADKPWRPLPSGAVGRRGALLAAAIAWSAGLTLSAIAGPTGVAFAVSWMLLLWLYSTRLKSAGLAGHVLVSAVASSGFILGAALGGGVVAGLVPFSVALSFHLAREIVKGAADMRGDAAAGVRTLAVGAGAGAVVPLSAASIAAAMALSIVPYAVGVYGASYLVPILAVQPFLGLALGLIVAPGRVGGAAAPPYGRVATILKAVMPVGLLAFLLGGMR